MPVGYLPAVFVSSTCYDLNQIRAELKPFLEGLGLDPIMSEYPSFPINPNRDTVANCIETVKAKADVFVLIIGSRYGSLVDSTVSVTNLEYLTGKAKGIPTYVFVSQSTKSHLHNWKKNPEGDYSDVVDSPKLFEFIESIYRSDTRWVYTFERAEDIIQTLRTQLAYLFMESLDLRARLKSTTLTPDMASLNGLTLELVLTKPSYWEYLLFAEVLKNAMDSHKTRRLDLKYQVMYGSSRYFDSPMDLIPFLLGHVQEISNTAQSLVRLIKQGLPVAFSEPGQSGNEQEIVYIARRLADGYEKFIDWTIEVIHAQAPPEFARLVELVAGFSRNAISEIETFAEQVYPSVQDNVRMARSGDTPVSINIQLNITMPDTADFDEEVARLTALFS